MNEECSAAAERIEEVAAAIMTANTDDLSRLGAISSSLEETSALLRDTRPLCAGLATSLQVGLEKIILDECGGIDEPLDVVAQGIAMLQQMQRQSERSGEEEIGDADKVREIERLSGVAVRGADAPAEQSAGDGEGEGLSPESILAVGMNEEGTSDAADVEEAPAAAMAVDPDIFADFTAEAEEHLDAAESTLLSLENDPENDEMLNQVFRAFHTIKGGAGFLNLDDIIQVSHAVEDVLDGARKGKLTITPSILDVVLESIDLLKNLLRDTAARLEGDEVPARGAAAFAAKVEAVGRCQSCEAGAGAPPAQEREAAAEAAPPPAPPSVPPPAGGNGQHRSADQHYVRVGTDKLDHLVNLVGELVITQTQVTQNANVLRLDDRKLNKDISQLGKISSDIQEISMSLRMVPIRATFERMARVVRDLARKCGKEVELHMEGEETELDKNVVEELVDPLTHMVRNAVDHGIEPPEERVKAGKPRRGQVRLQAYHKGGNILIELSDDGRGLDREKLLQKAVERGLVQAEVNLADAEVYDFIFHPGLSTAEKVSDVSGRGVGMDVVRRNIEQLRGKVEVDSQPGRGSTFAIRLPLTLAIIDGMVIGVGAQRYILPLTSIVRSLRPSADDLVTVMGRGEMVKVKDELFPLVRCYQRFAVKPRCEDPSESLIVLVEAEDQRYCLLVDELVGMQQVVIKALSEELRGERGLSGCAILGDGQVGLILDPNGLAREHSANGHREAELAR